MRRKSNILLKWAIVAIISLCIYGKQIIAQNPADQQNINSVQSFFVKSEITQNSGGLFFNVINIVNPTSLPIQIKTFLNKPEGWSLYGASIKDTIIPADDTSY